MKADTSFARDVPASPVSPHLVSSLGRDVLLDSSESSSDPSDAESEPTATISDLGGHSEQGEPALTKALYGLLAWVTSSARPGMGYSQMDWLRLTKQAKDLNGLNGDPLRTEITMDEVRRHATREDAWMVFNGLVYNVTPYLKFHPGGADMLMKAAGRDGTGLFLKHHPYVNMRALMDKCLVGRLAVDPLQAQAAAEIQQARLERERRRQQEERGLEARAAASAADAVALVRPRGLEQQQAGAASGPWQLEDLEARAVAAEARLQEWEQAGSSLPQEQGRGGGNRSELAGGAAGAGSPRQQDQQQQQHAGAAAQGEEAAVAEIHQQRELWQQHRQAGSGDGGGSGERAREGGADLQQASLAEEELQRTCPG